MWVRVMYKKHNQVKEEDRYETEEKKAKTTTKLRRKRKSMQGQGRKTSSVHERMARKVTIRSIDYLFLVSEKQPSQTYTPLLRYV